MNKLTKSLIVGGALLLSLPAYSASPAAEAWHKKCITEPLQEYEFVQIKYADMESLKKEIRTLSYNQIHTMYPEMVGAGGARTLKVKRYITALTAIDIGASEASFKAAHNLCMVFLNKPHLILVK